MGESATVGKYLARYSEDARLRGGGEAGFVEKKVSRGFGASTTATTAVFTAKDCAAGITNRFAAIVGWSVSWQHDIAQLDIPLISWPQFISCAGSVAVFL
jgi:hypothetical protein